MEPKQDDKYDAFLQQHKAQLIASNVPQIYWKTLHHKLTNEVFDAGQVFTILQVEEEAEIEEEDEAEKNNAADDSCVQFTFVAVAAEAGVKTNDPQHIYLVDHAWTYQVTHARQQLMQVAPLRSRMADLMGVDQLHQDGRDEKDVIEDILTEMWKFNQTYQFSNISPEDDSALEPLWYVMDEFGSQVQHGDEPSVRMVPFYHVPSKVTFSLMWPLRNLEYEDDVTRDYAFGYTNDDTRRAKLLPWIQDDLTDVSWQQSEISAEYLQIYSKEETLPESDCDPVVLPTDRKIRVFSNIKQVQTFLTDERFEVVEAKDQADIWWLNEHFKDYRSFSKDHPGKFINQFPCEMIVTVKDPMAIVSRRAASPLSLGSSDSSSLETSPKWLPTTFNLQTELAQFVSYYQHREERGLDNHWILKPWNLARGLDMHITNNVDRIVRLQESGPKVACKYIENPVLFHREELGDVKFDIRYIILLADTQPLQLYAFQVFWLRFANKAYSLDDLDDYQKHFTVMNYQTGAELKQVHYDEFIPMFDKQYPDFKWADTESKIFDMFRELFSAAVNRPPPAGLPKAPQSRAMYAIDLMLKWDTDEQGEKCMQPMICEVNFCPDCERACKYHPFFYNDVFSALFLGDAKDKHVVKL